MNQLRSRNALPGVFISVLAVILAISIIVPLLWTPVMAQSNIFAVGTVLSNSLIDSTGRMIVPQTPYVLYKESQLGQANFAIATTATSNPGLVVNAMGITKLTYMWKCDLGTEDVFINVYDETGLVLLNTYGLATGSPAGVWQQVYVASELAPNVTGGTLGPVTVRLPQRGVNFVLKNNNAGTATCNAKLVVGY